MCLNYDLKPKQAAKIKAEAQRRGYIRVWKICEEKRTGWSRGTRWKEGLRKAKNLKQRDGGWYAYLSLESAKSVRNYWGDEDHTIKICYAKPQWIKRFGKICMGKWANVGLFTHLCFPDWDKGDMTIREFRAMCKEKP